MLIGVGLIVPVVPDLICAVTGEGLSEAAWIGEAAAAALLARRRARRPLFNPRRNR